MRIKLRHYLFATVAILLIGSVAGVYLLQDRITEWAITKLASNLETKHGLVLTHGNISTAAFGAIRIDSIALKSKHKCTKIIADSIYLKLDIAAALSLKLRPKILSLCMLSIIITDAEGNGSGIASSEFVPENHTYTESSISLVSLLPNNSNRKPAIDRDSSIPVSSISRLTKLIGSLAQSRITIDSIALSYQKHNRSILFSMPQLTMNSNELRTSCIISTSTYRGSYDIRGYVTQPQSEFGFQIVNSTNRDFDSQIMQPEHQTTLSFDTLYITSRWLENNADRIEKSLSSQAIGLTINHPRVSNRRVIINHGGIDLNVRIDSSSVLVKDGSVATINSVAIPLHGDLKRDKGKPHITLNGLTDSIELNDFFGSIPDGLLQKVAPIKGKGKVTFEYSIDANLASPEELSLHLALTPYNLNIKSTGLLNLYSLNDPFTHIISSNGDTLKRIELNDNNPYYIPIEDISPYLISSVVAAEDGGFFSHKGYSQDGFEYAMARNLMEGRMARGGSTITMQLVKNIFLSQRKDIARKTEEAAITWIIENQRVISKERILELYLNIIEWGPRVNGVGEASKFYFNKPPNELELNESIFLACIIPRPNQYKQHIDTLGNLKPHMESYYNNMGGILHERGHISKEELDSLTPEISLQEHALSLKATPDADSVF